MKIGKRLLHGIGNSFGSALRSSRILVSTCQDIYSNLAMEDWIYQNPSFLSADADAEGGHSQSLILLWRNRPCIVVGRHQNCWVECNMHQALADGVQVARRRSGGGTVYHDLGNINITVFTDRKEYCRKKNLNVVAAALRETWDLDVAVTQRDDVLLNNEFKISGTAAKLGGKVAYHHFTLLVKADLDNVKKYLHGIESGIESKATASVRAKVVNLSNFNKNVTYEGLIESLSKAFTVAKSYNTPNLWSYVDPTNESTFPGIYKLSSELKQWDWVYGHTPKFQVQRTFSCHIRDEPVQFSVGLEVDHGRIKNSGIKATFSENRMKNEIAGICTRISSSLNGLRFWPSDINNLEDNFRTENDGELIDWTKGLFECIRKTVVGK